MTSNVLIAVFTVVTLLGWIGVGSKKVKGKLAGMLITLIGVLGLSFASDREYGRLGGMELVIYGVIAWLFFSILVGILCKKNDVKTVDQLVGLSAKMPYTFLILVVLGAFVIGIPGTGTFSAMMYSMYSLMSTRYGLFSFVGIAGILLGMVEMTIMVFGIIRHCYVREEREVKMPGKFISGLTMVITVALVVLSIYNAPVVQLVTTVYQTIFG